MDLLYVKNYLDNLAGHSPEYISEHVNTLSADIGEFLTNNIEDTNDETYRHRTMVVLQKYEEDLKVRSMSFDATPPRDLDDRCYKAQAIVATLSLLQVYVQDILSRYSTGINSNDSFYKYIRALSEKKNMYSSLMLTWSGVLKSITQEITKNIEIMKIRKSS